MPATSSIPAHVKSQRLRTWVNEIATLCKPDQVHWCDGSQAEYDTLCEQLVKSGTFKRLNPAKRPGQLPRLLRSVRRRPRRGSHLHLQPQQG